MPRTDLTPYRKLEVELELTPNVPTWVDVTMLLGTTEVKLEEEVNAIDKLSFRLVHDVVLFEPLIASYGVRVRFTGGYVAEFPDNARTFFIGIVTGWALKLPDNGKPELEVVAEDERAQMTLVKPGFITYPSVGVVEWGINVIRQWIYTDTLKISDIVTKMCGDYGIAINEVRIDPDLDFTFTLTDVDVGTQKENESDFEFLFRLLTGVGRVRNTGLRKDKRSLLCAQACWFMEYDEDSEQAKLTVVPEQDILRDTSGSGLRYQGVGFQKVPEDEYDPTSSTGEMIITNVVIRENVDQARVGATKHGKDVQHHAKGPKGPKNVGQLVRGALAARAAKAEGEDDTGPDGLGKELDLDKIQATFSGNTDATLAALKNKKTYQDIEEFTRDKQTRWPADSRKLTKDGDDAAARPQTEPPAGISAAPAATPGKRAVGKQKKEPKTLKWKALGEKIRNYGKVVTFSTRGNIYLKCRKMYQVEVPFDQYAGQYFLYKLTSVWGNQFRQTGEMGR